MKQHLETGRQGEDHAAVFIASKGFTVLHRNWRHGSWEIDLIASKADTVHFFEVKTRRSARYGYPEAAVTKTKIRAIYAAAAAFCQQFPQWKKRQYNILSILMEPGKPVNFFLIEDIS